MDIQSLLDNYINWLKSEITFSQIGEYYEITTPFLDPSNDYLQIYVKQEGADIFFSDDSNTIRNLELNGLSFTPKRKNQLAFIANQFGVALNGDELVAKAPIKEFPQKKHMFVQTMLRISDMYMTSQNRVTSFFLDDVTTFFKEKDIYATENVSFFGKSGYNHVYDFLFPRSRTMPERLCNLINNPNKTNINSTLFAWLDTRQTRKKDSQLLLLINDENKVSEEALDAAHNYDVSIIKWSERNQEKNLSMLAS
ncbi:MAG TPA: DUF1829 domain-containing protein [Candidatus Eisenbergiella pullicola]|nr:DUF1829 domain-containing protein [Candidatus Eisenbergiella pullicola]